MVGAIVGARGGRVEREGRHLDGRHVALEADNLSDELGVAHAHELVHRSAGHLVGDHDRARDGEDTTNANHLREAWWVSDLEGGGGLGQNVACKPMHWLCFGLRGAV